MNKIYSLLVFLDIYGPTATVDFPEGIEKTVALGIPKKVREAYAKKTDGITAAKILVILSDVCREKNIGPFTLRNVIPKDGLLIDR